MEPTLIHCRKYNSLQTWWWWWWWWYASSTVVVLLTLNTVDLFDLKHWLLIVLSDTGVDCAEYRWELSAQVAAATQAIICFYGTNHLTLAAPPLDRHTGLTTNMLISSPTFTHPLITPLIMEWRVLCIISEYKIRLVTRYNSRWPGSQLTEGVFLTAPTALSLPPPSPDLSHRCWLIKWWEPICKAGKGCDGQSHITDNNTDL